MKSRSIPRKILNYNPNMEYRRQGKTGLMVSAVCLGGHSRSNDQERPEIVSRCIDVGINYIDACWDNEVKRDAKALKGRRDKMYLGLSHGAKEVRNEDFRTSKKLLESLDELLKDSEQEYTDLWRITCLEPGGRHTFDTACEIVDALEKAKKQGKARFVGFSSHDRRWIKFMIEYFPQIDVVCFPFTTMSKKAPQDSLFEALKKRDVGAFGIKPFAAGSLFAGDARGEQPARPPGHSLHPAHQHRHPHPRHEQPRGGGQRRQGREGTAAVRRQGKCRTGAGRPAGVGQSARELPVAQGLAVCLSPGGRFHQVSHRHGPDTCSSPSLAWVACF